MKSFFFALLFSIVALSLSAQNKIGIKADVGIDQLLQSYINQQQTRQIMPGYRIQVAQNSNREIVRAEKTNALSRFPQYEVYEVYESPSFKIRIGDFRTRISGYKALQDSKLVFKKAFLIEDKINVGKMR